jgi:Zn-dependent metalloprotease
MAIRAESHLPHSVIPPYVFEQLALNGSATQRRRALNSLLLDQSVRTARTLAPRSLAQAAGGAQRSIFDAHNTQALPGELVRQEDESPTEDAAADEAYDGLGATYDMFAEVYERDSIDGAGLSLHATVHFDVDYDNAYWDGSQMVFGDGDNELFNRFTIDLDVIGHELTHGVTEVETGLVYWGQAGALNESISDVFGSLVKQYASNADAESADWLIGANLFTDAVQGQALRSMKAPGTAYDDPVLGRDPQPAHMRDYVRTFEDNGGVHINSGIPNYAFYLSATAMGGYAWEKAGRIWYDTLLDTRVPARIGFRGFARLTAQNAARIYGFTSDECRAVREAWAQVGVVLGAPVRAATGLASLVEGPHEPAALSAGAQRPWAVDGSRGSQGEGAAGSEARPRAKSARARSS